MHSERGDQCLCGLIIQRSVEIAEDAEGIAVRRLRNESRHRPLISDEHHFLLVTFEPIEDGAEVSCHLGRRQRFHSTSVSDSI
jgi:hypothetical protein